ncbi:hypothetical protein HDV03_002433, partial [Kappamyces sp. JEL0829]
MAFKAVQGGSVVTGHWGCGAFLGDKTFKFLQQLCAAAEAGLDRLDYSVYQEADTAQWLTHLALKLEEDGWTVGDVYTKVFMAYASLLKEDKKRAPLFKDFVGK